MHRANWHPRPEEERGRALLDPPHLLTHVPGELEVPPPPRASHCSPRCSRLPPPPSISVSWIPASPSLHRSQTIYTTTSSTAVRLSLPLSSRRTLLARAARERLCVTTTIPISRSLT